jgi:hypothetical protein
MCAVVIKLWVAEQLDTAVRDEPFHFMLLTVAPSVDTPTSSMVLDVGIPVKFRPMVVLVVVNELLPDV